MRIIRGIMRVLGAILVAVGFIAKSPVPAVLGIALILFAQRLKKHAEDSRRAELQAASVRPALNDVFDSADYRPDEQLDKREIDSMQLLLHTQYQYTSGSDKITATHRGVRILLGNVRLMATEVFRDEETNMERTTEKELWQGLMLTCKIGHMFPIGFAVTPRGKIDGVLKYADVKTGNEEFDRSFTVKTDNPEFALLTLTPGMQEKILAAARVSPGAFYVTFCQDGRVSAAVRTGRNFFVSNKKGSDAVRADLAENLRRLLAIIDETNPLVSAQEEEA